MNLHLPGIAVNIGFLCSSISQATAKVIGRGPPCFHGSHLGCSLYSMYFESPPLPCWSVLLPPPISPSCILTRFYRPYRPSITPTTVQALLPLPHHLLPAATLKYRNKNLTFQPSWNYRVCPMICHVFIGDDAVNLEKLYSFLNFCQKGRNIMSDKRMQRL